jgi:hypothetical protein
MANENPEIDKDTKVEAIGDEVQLNALTLLINKKEGSLPSEVLSELNKLVINLPEEVRKSFELYLSGPKKFNSIYLQSGINYPRYNERARSLASSLKNKAALTFLMKKAEPFEFFLDSKDDQFKRSIGHVSNIFRLVEEYEMAVTKQSTGVDFISHRFETGNPRVAVPVYLVDLKKRFLDNIVRIQDHNSRRIEREIKEIQLLLDEPNKLKNLEHKIESMDMPLSLKTQLKALSPRAVREKIIDVPLEYEAIANLYKDIEGWKLIASEETLLDLRTILEGTTKKTIKSDELSIYNVLGALLTHIYVTLGINPDESSEEES